MIYSIENEQEWEAIVNEVVMLSGASRSAFLIVEGATDAKFFATFVDENTCDLVIGYGKAKALCAIKRLNEQNFTGALCIVDRDFETILGDNENVPNVVRTDAHDVETMIVQSPALEKILREMGSEAKIEKNKIAGRNFRTDITRAAFPLGVARLYSLINEVHIKFEGFKYRYITIKLDYEASELIKELLNNSQIRDHDPNSFLDFLAEKSSSFDVWYHMTCGHDLAVMAGKALQSLWGSKDSREVNGTEMESRLRLAYEADHFRATDLYVDIKKWEAANSPLKCLAI